MTDHRTARADRAVRGDRSLRRALGEWQAAVVRGDDLDPLTTEIVRLRCAWHHDCRT